MTLIAKNEHIIDFSWVPKCIVHPDTPATFTAHEYNLCQLCSEIKRGDCGEYEAKKLMEEIKAILDGPANDPVNHPSHYASGKIEVIDAIEDWGLDFSCGNAVKYVARAGKKDKSKEIEDLKKAIWYINRKIKTLEKAK